MPPMTPADLQSILLFCERNTGCTRRSARCRTSSSTTASLADDRATLDDSELDGWFNRDWGPDAPVVLVDTESLNAWVTGVGGTGRD